jgi:ribosomal protein S12 methylthiotransferase
VPALRFTGGPFAYLKIAEGCNHRCSFCAIPGIRGRYRSRPAASIVHEAEQLLQHGVRELNLISQDTTAYGLDLRNGSSLAGLLRDLDGIGGKFWIRLLYGYPSGVSGELLEAMSATKVCHYLDVPIQHSHPRILKAMRRAGTVRPVHRMADRVRRALPDVALRTTCLVGFPGETEEHFEHLLDFVGRTRFDHLGAFVFSPEEHTRAFDLPDRRDREIAEERRGRLLSLQREIVKAKAAALLGRETEILLERKVPGAPVTWAGRSRRSAPEVDGVVLVTRVPRDAAPGDFIRVRYTARAGYDMRAVAVGSP